VFVGAVDAAAVLVEWSGMERAYVRVGEKEYANTIECCCADRHSCDGYLGNVRGVMFEGVSLAKEVQMLQICLARMRALNMEAGDNH
jgi:hypothetical protein